MLSSFKDKIIHNELRNLRSLNVFTSVIVTALGFIFEFSYHDGYILMTGLGVSMVLTSNYFLSFYSSFYRKQLPNITYASIFLLHFWAVYVAFMRNFEIDFLLPVSISIFIFSLVFDKFFKSLFFIFTITTFMMVMMLISNRWLPEFTITLVVLYSGAFLSDQIQKRKTEYQDEIEKQEGRYVSLVENMNDGLVYVDHEYKLIYVNDRFCEITGYSRENLLGRSITELSPERNKLDVKPRKFFQDLSAGQSVRCECDMLKLNGERIYVQMSGSPYSDDEGNNIGSMIVFADIHALKSAQELLKKREEGYRTFIDQSAVGIWRAEYRQPIPVSLPFNEQVELLLDSGIIAECNDFMARMYGYSSSNDLVGRKIRDFYYIENNYDEEKTRELLASFIKNNYKISNAESKELDLYGNVRFMLNNNIGIVEQGHLMRTWGVQTDITDRKKTEKELVETNQELDTFFYKASHDLKGPLASVMGIVNLARLENKDGLIDKYFDMVDTSIRRLDRTLLDLIDLARTRKGASKLSVINVKGLVDEILHSLKHLPDYDHINFEIKIDQKVEITSDKVLILSVFQNLIHNAINYCNHQSPWIRVKVEETDRGIEIEVADNGKGIPEPVKNRVFEMFYRGHPDSNGSGLGLFIVKNALEKIKGKIRFVSEPGNGTVFYVSIPNSLIEA
ncbi:MAG: PAS domain S-box protein [Bacteroidetes bacterium]|nr:PAS domain S-box protein [Bacteroidota bacterium]MBK9543547.1 PAS domain S-box protein [Bacteroidota bacterium]MBL0256471.1 PAS domain S-box protein [Bacteroidota bacterium]MBP6402073.1 PAS domain S-box protein [Bacteroidia bacterium]MBP6649441.1 PAS domain S-box protein [Bacteroidia bacterium]